MEASTRTPSEWLEVWGITDFKDTKDGIIVNGDVTIRGVKGQLPVKFSKVTGNFTARFCSLASWNNFPTEVGGSLDVSHNYFRDLLNLKIKVGGDFVIHSNKNLLSIEGIQKVINGKLDISNCALTNLNGFPEQIDGDLIAFKNKFTSLHTGNTIKVGGNADFSENKIVTESRTIVVGGRFDDSDNPINPSDDLKEKATWS